MTCNGSLEALTWCFGGGCCIDSVAVRRACRRRSKARRSAHRGAEVALTRRNRRSEQLCQMSARCCELLHLQCRRSARHCGGTFAYAYALIGTLATQTSLYARRRRLRFRLVKRTLRARERFIVRR